MFVRNLPAHATQAALIAHFAQLRFLAIVTDIIIAPFFIQNISPFIGIQKISRPVTHKISAQAK